MRKFSTPFRDHFFSTIGSEIFMEFFKIKRDHSARGGLKNFKSQNKDHPREKSSKSHFCYFFLYLKTHL